MLLVPWDSVFFHLRFVCFCLCEVAVFIKNLKSRYPLFSFPYVMFEWLNTSSLQSHGRLNWLGRASDGLIIIAVSKLTAITEPCWEQEQWFLCLVPWEATIITDNFIKILILVSFYKFMIAEKQNMTNWWSQLRCRPVEFSLVSSWWSV